MTVIGIKGKQYIIKEGEKVTVPHIEAKIGDKVEAKDLLNSGKVILEVVDQVRGEKIRVLRYKAKTRHLKWSGSRANLTVVQMSSKKEEKKEVKEVLKKAPVKKTLVKKDPVKKVVKSKVASK